MDKLLRNKKAIVFFITGISFIYYCSVYSDLPVSLLFAL